MQTQTALFGVEAVFGEFVLATKEGVVLVGVELAEQFGLGGEVDGGVGGVGSLWVGAVGVRIGLGRVGRGAQHKAQRVGVEV